MPISIAVLTRDQNDLLSLLQTCSAVNVTVFAPDALTPHCLDKFDCACLCDCKASRIPYLFQDVP